MRLEPQCGRDAGNAGQRGKMLAGPMGKAGVSAWRRNWRKFTLLSSYPKKQSLQK